MPFSLLPLVYLWIGEVEPAAWLTTSEEVGGWRRTISEPSPLEIAGKEVPLVDISDATMPAEAIEDVIQRRGSTRRFARKPMPFFDLSAIIDRATRGISTDFLAREAAPINDLYAIVNRVEGLPPGAYFYRRKEHALELLKPGDFSSKASYLTLGQDLGGDASVTFFFMSDLNLVLEAYGNRGYRAAQMEAGITGGKMYLASYALRRGATGLTFFDDDVTEFFSPHAAGKSCILAVSIGVPGKRPIA